MTRVEVHRLSGSAQKWDDKIMRKWEVERMTQGVGHDPQLEGLKKQGALFNEPISSM